MRSDCQLSPELQVPAVSQGSSGRPTCLGAPRGTWLCCVPCGVVGPRGTWPVPAALPTRQRCMLMMRGSEGLQRVRGTHQLQSQMSGCPVEGGFQLGTPVGSMPRQQPASTCPSGNRK